MKALFATLLAALFAFAAGSAYAAPLTPVAGMSAEDPASPPSDEEKDKDKEKDKDGEKKPD